VLDLASQRVGFEWIGLACQFRSEARARVRNVRTWIDADG
jgi:hypothetical protein